MSDWLLEQYDEYLEDFKAWGHEFYDQPLSCEDYESASAEMEGIDIAEECGYMTDENKRRREQLERLMLTHASYFADGPRVVVIKTEDSTPKNER